MRKKILLGIEQNRTEQLFFVSVFFLYCACSIIKFSPGITVFGLSLLFYFPGKFLMELLPALKFSNGYFGKISFSFIYSFCLICVVGLYSQNLWGFNSNNQIWVIAAVNLVIFLAYKFLPKIKSWQKFAIQDKKPFDYKTDRFDYIPIILFLAAIIGWIIISPLAQNTDNFLGILKQSASQNLNLLVNRRIFISLLELVSKFLDIGIIIVYRYFPVALFLVASLSLYDYLRRNFGSRIITTLLYLILLAPAVILTEVNNIRPQVILLAITIPVLILLIESLKKKSLLSALIGLIIAGISFLFHELGFVLLLVALITTLIHLGRLIFTNKKTAWKYILLFLVIIYPYTKLVDMHGILHPLEVIRGYSIEILSRGPVHWRWWFINHYVDADGVVVSFAGKNVLLYYLYNGILLLFLLFYLAIILIIKKIRLGVHFIPPTLYFLFFFSSAEIFPRVTLTYLPSRAWVHLMLPAIILLVLALEIFEKRKIKIKYLPSTLIILIIIGFTGSLYVAKTNIKEIYAEELPAANFIKKELPGNSIFISSQENIDLVKVYGDTNNYVQIAVTSLIDKNGFEQLVNPKVEEISKNKIIVLRPKLVQTIDSFENNILQSSKVTTLQNEQDETFNAMNSGNNPIYFVYSYRKLDALNTADQDRQESADPANKNTYSNIGYQSVYNDKNVLIIKIR